MTRSTPEEYFVKLSNGKYQSIGTHRPDYLPNGLYFHQNQKYGSRTTSVQHWVGQDPKQPIDLNRLVSLMKKDEELGHYLSEIQRESPEYEKLKLNAGGYVSEPPRIFNISMQELAIAILRFLYEQESKDDRTFERNAL